MPVRDGVNKRRQGLLFAFDLHEEGDANSGFRHRGCLHQFV